MAQPRLGFRAPRLTPRRPRQPCWRRRRHRPRRRRSLRSALAVTSVAFIKFETNEVFGTLRLMWGRLERNDSQPGPLGTATDNVTMSLLSCLA